MGVLPPTPPKLTMRGGPQGPGKRPPCGGTPVYGCCCSRTIRGARCRCCCCCCAGVSRRGCCVGCGGGASKCGVLGAVISSGDVTLFKQLVAVVVDDALALDDVMLDRGSLKVPPPPAIILDI